MKKIAAVLPVDATINILNPVIATGDFPTNLCAIKLLSELVSCQGDQVTDAHIDSIMPNIAKVCRSISRKKAYLNTSVVNFGSHFQRTDDLQSMVRKAAVFCIVGLYLTLGEERVKPKFSLLNSSKNR